VLYDNPDIEGRKIVRLILNDGDLEFWSKPTGLENIPMGFRGFSRASGNILEFGIEKIPAGGAGAVIPPQGGDMLDGKTLAELQTLAARKGVKYSPNDDKPTIIQAIRAKGMK